MRWKYLALVALFALPCSALVFACSSYDATDYTTEVRTLAAAELHCDAGAVEITPVPDDHGTHTFVCDGCGCTATYICSYKDFDSCQRLPALEAVDASCR